MPALGSVFKVLASIPWQDVFERAPEVLNAARRLLARNKDVPSPQETLESRVARLEQNEAEQARLVESMARQQELLIATMGILRTRLRYLSVGLVLLAAGLLFALLRR